MWQKVAKFKGAEYFRKALYIHTHKLSHLHRYSLDLVLCWSTFGRNESLKSSWVWHYKLGTPEIGEFLPILSNSVRFDGERCCTAIFRSLQRCLIGFKSGFWLGYSRTVRDLSRSHFCNVLAMCLGWLSCWKVNLHPSLRTCSRELRISLRISLYFALFIFASILTSLPVPAAKKHPYSMMLPPPCFTVKMVPGFLQTWLLAFRPILFLMVWESLRCILANSEQAVMCLLLRSGFHLTTLSSRSDWWSAAGMVVLLESSSISTEELWSS